MGFFDGVDAWLSRIGTRRTMRDAFEYSLATFPEATRGQVTGVVKPFERRVLEAPLSGRLCVYHEVELFEVRSTGKVPIQLAREPRAIPFLIEDDTGRAIVDPAHARFACKFDHASSSHSAFDADPRQRALLERFSLVKRRWGSTRELRYRESVIALDGSITVVGAGVREPDPDRLPSGDRGYRQGGPTRMQFSGTAAQPLLLTDDSRLA